MLHALLYHRIIRLIASCKEIAPHIVAQSSHYMAPISTAAQTIINIIEKPQHRSPTMRTLFPRQLSNIERQTTTIFCLRRITNNRDQ